MPSWDDVLTDAKLREMFNEAINKPLPPLLAPTSTSSPKKVTPFPATRPTPALRFRIRDMRVESGPSRHETVELSVILTGPMTIGAGLDHLTEYVMVEASKYDVGPSSEIETGTEIVTKDVEMAFFKDALEHAEEERDEAVKKASGLAERISELTAQIEELENAPKVIYEPSF